jgi:hypothetical protein
LIVQDGYIRENGPSSDVVVPSGARVVDPEFDGRRMLDRPEMAYVPAEVAESWRHAGPLDVPSELSMSRYAALTDLAKRMHAAGVPVLAGTDMSDEVRWQLPGYSLHDELLLLAEAGLSPSDAIRAATAEPARVFGVPDSGTLEPGKIAVMVLLGADPLEDIRNTRRIVGVVVRGTYLDRVELDEMLAGVAEGVSAGGSLNQVVR